MIKIVGEIVSANTFIKYKVGYNQNERTAWISKIKGSWIMVCEHVPNSDSAVICAQRFIDSQPKLY